jgi:hypothetical protein
MSSSQPSQNDDPTPFGGCARLLSHYQQVGAALIQYERVVCGSLLPGQRYVREFGQAVSFVPVEVLESYLDDLLDLGVNDESLFIRKTRPAKRALFLVVLCVATIAYLGYLAFSGESNAAWPLLTVVAFSAGIGSALYFLPRTKALRRFSFATVMSREIARRRGHDRTSIGDFATRLLHRELWGAKPVGRVAALHSPISASCVLKPQLVPWRSTTGQPFCSPVEASL